MTSAVSARSAADSADRFKQADAESYNAVNLSFDKFTRRLSTPLAQRMAALAGLRAGEAVLDVGSGTGVAALAAGRAVGPTGSVIGLDLSEGMLAVARANAKAEGLDGHVRFVQGDAEQPDLPDARFDVVLSLFALLHLPDPDKALAEMRRMLKPGGRLVIGLGSGPSAGSLPGLLHRAQRAWGLVNEALGRELRATAFLDALVAQAAPAAAEDAMPAWTGGRGAHPPGVDERIAAAGFAGIRTFWQGHIATIASPDEFWELQATYSSFARKRMAQLPPEALAALRRRFDERCAAVQRRGGRLVYPYGAAFFVAHRPA